MKKDDLKIALLVIGWFIAIGIIASLFA